MRPSYHYNGNPITRNDGLDVDTEFYGIIPSIYPGSTVLLLVCSRIHYVAGVILQGKSY